MFVSALRRMTKATDHAFPLALLRFKQFVNLISGSNLGVGSGLKSCTDNVQTVDFTLDGRRVVLIDTPGFDDTTLSDTDVLNMIAAFLESS
jgi:hypothetical protein